MQNTENNKVQVLDSSVQSDDLIPAYRYISRDYVLAEQEWLWPYVWQVACREEEVPGVGDYLEYQIADQTVLIVRVKPDQIKAYHNVCLHRGTRIKKGCGTATELRCMFHSWCWNLDGSNKEITDQHDFPDIDPEQLRLSELRIGFWAGFVFVNFNPDAESLEEFLGPVPELFDHFKMDQAHIQSCRRTTFRSNWKVPIDNFNESFHVMGLHPQQLPFINDVGAIYETAGNHSTELVQSGVQSPRLGGSLDEDEVFADMMDAYITTFYRGNDDKREEIEALSNLSVPEGSTARDLLAKMKRERLTTLGVDSEGYSDSDLIDGHGLHLFPNVVMHINYGEFFIVRTRPNGNDPDTCIGEIINLDFPAQDEERGRAVVQEIADPDSYDWGVVVEQDLCCFTEVQRGLHSRGLPGIRLAKYQELRIRHMHDMLERYIGK